MEILKRGTLPEDKTYEATCDFCKTEVRFKRVEAKSVPNTRNENILEIECPVCHRKIYKDI